MSRRARDWAWGCRGLKPAQRLVLLALAELADDNGEHCFPSLGLLERMTELSRRGITKALGELDGRLISRERGGPRRSTSYRLPISDPGGGGRQIDGPGRRSAGTGGEHSSPAAGREQGSLGNRVPEGREQGSPGREQSATLVGNRVPPNRHRNRHVTVSEPSLPGGGDAGPLQGKQKVNGKARPIPSEWRPSGRVMAWAAKQGMSAEWVEDQVDEFVVYWTDRGDDRKSWDATFMNRLRALQAQRTKGKSDATRQPFAAKDYRKGSTPLDEIPWLGSAAVG